MPPLPFNPLILLLLALIIAGALIAAVSAWRGTRLRETRRGRRR